MYRQVSNSLGEQHLGIQLTLSRSLATNGSQSKIALPGPSLHLLLGAGVVLRSLRPSKIGSDLVWRHKFLVLVDDGSAERSLLDHNRCKDESGTNLDQVDVGIRLSGSGLGLGLLLVFLALLFCRFDLVDLIVADPDLAINEAETHNVVYERLRLSGTLRNAKSVEEKLLDDS
ncbi:hypothetical protein HG530_000929 [Fusarium avenaceum]|nr:hypothetical protein HG530_000929 [Fusarium avenaceum]